MSDNSAGSPANTQTGPEVAGPDETAQRQLSIKEAVSAEEVSDKTQGQPPVAQAEDGLAPPQVGALAAPVVGAARQVAVRPRIGDTRPAPPPSVPAEPAVQSGAPQSGSPQSEAPADVVALASPA